MTHEAVLAPGRDRDGRPCIRATCTCGARFNATPDEGGDRIAVWTFNKLCVAIDFFWNRLRGLGGDA